MKTIKFTDLNKKEQLLVEKAFEAAEHSIASRGHKVGCAISCYNGELYVGATNARTRVIGSTCAERMAVDQLMYQGNKKPNLCVLVSLLKRKNWTGSSIGTPCGACLEMFWELSMKLDMNDLHFLCVSWNKKKVLKVKLSELYPRFDAVRR